MVLHRMLPVTNVLAIEVGEARRIQRGRAAGITGSCVGGKVHEAVIRVGLHDLTAGAPRYPAMACGERSWVSTRDQ